MGFRKPLVQVDSRVSEVRTAFVTTQRQRTGTAEIRQTDLKGTTLKNYVVIWKLLGLGASIAQSSIPAFSVEVARRRLGKPPSLDAGRL
jgi:hypothetical protein